MTHAARLAAALAFLACLPTVLRAQFTAPTPEELSMTSIPEVPGAPAVTLYAEQTAEDNMRMWSYYYRVKVLTEGGRDQANVELPYIVNDLGISIDSILGRTIHPDGTIVPFTGKPYEKLIEKGGDYKVKSKVFTLPQVEVGSILEYRYKFRFDDAYVVPPDWYIQSNLFLRKGHYSWKPTGSEVQSDGSLVHVAWAPLLPVGAEVKERPLQRQATGSDSQARVAIELDVQNIPPIPKEQFMPPMNSLSYRVLFYYTAAKTPAEYWSTAGKKWSKARDKFIGPGNAVRAEAASLAGPTDTAEVKLKKFYDAIQLMENTDYTRERTTQEEKASGLKNATNTDDILTRKRGNSTQLTELFVALARAAGMKAYVMTVTNRDEHLFNPSYLNFSQLDDSIAIVNVEGKDQFFDPGDRFTTFKHLAWQHTVTAGLRQTDGGNAEIASIPGEPYTSNHTSRIADVTLDDHGVATGTVGLEYTGDAALRWRHIALRGDDTSLNTALRANLEERLPGGMEVRVTDVKNLSDPDKPLRVTYDVKGPIGNATGKRLLLPYSLFEVDTKPEFTAEKRELAVDMEYAKSIQDAVRYKFPESFTIESVPPPDSQKCAGTAGYATSAKQAGNAVTVYRNLTIGKVYYMPNEYQDLRTFYGKLDAKQQEVVVVTHAAGAGAKPAGGN